MIWREIGMSTAKDLHTNAACSASCLRSSSRCEIFSRRSGKVDCPTGYTSSTGTGWAIQKGQLATGHPLAGNWFLEVTRMSCSYLHLQDKTVDRSVHHAGRSLRICKCVCQEAGRRGWRCVRVLSCNLGGCTRLICISIQRRPSKWHKCPAAWTNVQLFVGIPTAWMTTHMFGILAADQYLIPEPTYVNGLQALWPAMRVISEAIPTGCQSSHLNSSSGDCPEPVRNRRPSSSTSWAIRSSKPGIFDCSKFSHARLIYARTLQKDTAMRLRCDCDCCCYSYCFCGVSSQRTTGLTGPAGSESEAVSSVTTIHCENFH